MQLFRLFPAHFDRYDFWDRLKFIINSDCDFKCALSSSVKHGLNWMRYILNYWWTIYGNMYVSCGVHDLIKTAYKISWKARIQWSHIEKFPKGQTPAKSRPSCIHI
jgi:hypothetical protein